MTWLSAVEGMVYLEDCRGVAHASAEIGKGDSQRPGPMIDGRPSLIVIHDPEWGTDFMTNYVAVFQYRNGAIAKLWDHPSFLGVYPPKGLGGHWEETFYRWRFTSGARRIEVTGRDVIYRDEEPHRRKDVRRIRLLKPEHFCLNVRAMKYRPCR